MTIFLFSLGDRMFWELDVNVESVMSYVYHFIDFGQYF
jgi:hypothetical protein